MDAFLNKLSMELAEARAKCAEDLRALNRVRELLSKADEKRTLEPEEARKWNRVLENLENSLDLTRSRFQLSEARVQRLESDIARVTRDTGGGAGTPAAVAAPQGADAPVSDWDHTMSEVGALNLEEASLLQSRIDSGEIHDEQLEAGLELANQMREGGAAEVAVEGEGSAQEQRRQLVLRAAIEKIRKQQFDQMSLDEVKLVIACHSLLTSRLEPTPRDQRLRRILDGAIKILQRRKDEMEGR
jgi:hypothetical protein